MNPDEDDIFYLKKTSQASMECTTLKHVNAFIVNYKIYDENHSKVSFKIKMCNN